MVGVCVVLGHIHVGVSCMGDVCVCVYKCWAGMCVVVVVWGVLVLWLLVVCVCVTHTCAITGIWCLGSLW